MFVVFIIVFMIFDVSNYNVHDFVSIRGPKFDLVARGSLLLSDVDESVRTFDVELEKSAG